MSVNQGPVGFNLEKLLKQVEGQKFPPVEKWNPPFCGDIDMRIARDGTWFYMGTPITRERMVKLFSTVLRRDEDGSFYLVTPVEKVGIQVEDAPFIATALDIVEDGDEQFLYFTTNVGDHVIADQEHPIRVETDIKTGEPSPYILIRGRLEALLSRSVFYELVNKASEIDHNGERKLVINSKGVQFELGTLDDE